MKACAASLLFCSALLSAKPACEVFPIDDAVVVLSQNAQQHEATSAGCLYEISTPHLTLLFTISESVSKATFAELKQRAEKAGEAVKDEPGLGPYAFSSTTKDAESIAILEGTTALTLILSNSGSSTPLPDLMYKLRIVAKRALARL
jgi:hypothetical protein